MSSMFSALVNRPHGPTPVREAAYSENGLDCESTPALEPFRDFVKMQQCEEMLELMRSETDLSHSNIGPDRTAHSALGQGSKRWI